MLKQFLIKQINKTGFDIVRLNKPRKWPVDFEEHHKSIIKKVEPFTMTSWERLYGLIEAVQYIERKGVVGDIVECGVWRGGSMLAVAETLLHMNSDSRELYLYDTFEGMPPPSTDDVSYTNQSADKLLNTEVDKEESLIWAYSPLDNVKKTMSLSNYPEEKCHYVVGKVEDTIPKTLPKQIALLRLDTDWYESTKHELNHLYPLLAPGGVVIIDDYGFWKGARKAVDEYFAGQDKRILLTRMDDTGRMGVKLS